MVKFQIASDLHIEYKNNIIPDPEKYITPSCKNLILAGDVGSLYKYEQLKGFLEKLCSLFETVLYVPGNNEFYMQKDYTPLNLYTLEARMRNLENEIENLYFLDKTSVKIDNVCIAGCTLWSDPKCNLPKFIVKIHGINNNIYKSKFLKDVEYIKKVTKYCNDKNLKLLLITHHLPTYDIIPESRKADRFISLYASNLNNLIKTSKIHTWVCGHIHKNFNTTFNNTKFISNQYGKPKDNINDFQKNFIIEV